MPESFVPLIWLQAKLRLGSGDREKAGGGVCAKGPLPSPMAVSPLCESLSNATTLQKDGQEQSREREKERERESRLDGIVRVRRTAIPNLATIPFSSLSNSSQ